MAAQFGIVTDATRASLTGIMIIQSISFTDESDFVEGLDEDGDVEIVQEVVKPKKITVEGILTGAATAAAATLSIDGVNYYITNVEVKEENEGWKTISLEGILATGITIS